MRRWIAALVGLLGLLAATGGADDTQTKAAARAALGKYKDVIVTVRLTVKNRMVFQGQEREGPESTMEINGTLLSPGGLTAVSDFSSNPAGLFQSAPGSPKMDTQTTDVKLVLGDGRELPARFVLRDQDLDLAFLMPEEKVEGLPSLALEKGALPDTLDDLILLYPLGKSLSRTLAVSLTRVRAIVRKPRTFLVTDLLDSLTSLGCPVFDGAGRAVGLTVLRRSPLPPTGDGGIRQLLDVMNPVILTAEDVQQVAAQAVAAAAKPRS